MFFFLSYFYSGQIFSVSEPDGIRIIGQETCDFLEKVPGLPFRYCGLSNPLSSLSFKSFDIQTGFNISRCNTV